MTRRWVAPLAMTVAVLLQLSWAPRWNVGGGVPDLVTLVAVAMGFLSGPRSGALSGFFGGLALDALGLGPVGVGALARMLAGLIAGLVGRTLLGKSIVLPMAGIAAGSAAAAVFELLLLLLLGRNVPVAVSVARIVLPMAVYNGLLAGLIYPLLGAAVESDKSGPASVERIA